MTESPASPKMSSAALRKIKKPIIEKRRRERINDSLNQLKALVLDSLQKDESRYSKMEKADILEMTVRHLKTVQRQQALIQAVEDRDLYTKYRAGYTECAQEVGRFLGSPTEFHLPEEVRQRLMRHLSGCVQQKATRAHSPTATITSPTATPTSTLPGSTSSSQMFSRTSSPISPAPSLTSPLSVSSCSPGLPISEPQNNNNGSILLISPTPIHPVQQQPGMVKSAIPLYLNGVANCGQSPMGICDTRSRHQHSTVSRPQSESRVCTRSPQTADEVPYLFANDKYVQPTEKVSRQTVVISPIPAAHNHTCTSQARYEQHQQDLMVKTSPWRPW